MKNYDMMNHLSLSAVINALCPNCNQIKDVEACVHCYQPLCSDCISIHVDQWRLNSIKYCDTIEKKVEKYLTRIDTLSPLINKNKENIRKAKVEIDDLFKSFVLHLEEQKDDLFKKLDEIEKDNEKFKNFESDITSLRCMINEFQQTAVSPNGSTSSLTSNNENLSDKEKLMMQFKKFHICKEQVNKIGTNYTGLKKKPFKIIGEYEKPSSTMFDLIDGKNLFGNLIINESDLLKSKESQNSNNTKRKAPTAPTFESPLITLQQDQTYIPPQSNSKVHMFGTLRIKLKRLVELNDLNTIIKPPKVEFNVNIAPKHLACFSNFVFIFDDDIGQLAITELDDTLKIRSIHKLNLTNQMVKSICVNKKYLAIALSDMTKEKWQLISKYYNISNELYTKFGILIFRLNEQVSSITFDKIITSTKIITPQSIVISQSQINDLFISDRESHAIFRMDIKTSQLTSKFIMKNNLQQEPTGMCLTERHLIYVDSYKLEINVCDISSNEFNLVRNFKIFNNMDADQIDVGANLLFNEPYFDISYSKSTNLIFIKNKADSKLIIYDYNSHNSNMLTLKYSLDYENSNFQGMTYLKLATGKNKSSKNNNDEYFMILGSCNKLGLFSNF